MADIDTLGKYEIRREIGRGAMGVVYEAYDPSIKRVVAMKTIRADQLAGEDPGAVIARFRREAQAAGRLNHPNIVSIYDFGEDSSIWYIAMEFVKGRELKECFDTGERFKVADAVRIMTQILDALAYSHRQGVIHRDIKPANIFLLEDGTVKVADFGIAHIESSNLTQVGTMLGTPAYMSPEQIQGLPVDGRSDLFSAGVILYQFLTGERPFAGSASTTMQKVLKEEPLAPSTLNVQLPPAMDAVVRKALAKRADDRFQTAQDFAEALRAVAPSATATGTGSGTATVPLVNTEATVIATVNRTTPMAGAPSIPAAPPSSTSATAPPKESRFPPVAIAVVAGAIAIGAAAWFIQHQMSADTAKPAQGPAPVATVAAPAPAPAPAAAAAKSDPGTLVISAVGLVDPNDPRYHHDMALLQSDLRADSRGQLVEKAVGFLLTTGSLSKNYDLLKERLLSKSGSYVKSVIREGQPRTGKDGLMSLTTEAVVDVKAIQKSLNEMSRQERVDLIRASGNPKISAQISVSDADQPGAPPFPSPVAENILKERIKSFGFRTWAEGGGGNQGADFVVIGEAKVKKLSMRLEASGLIVTKFTLTSWTVKCIDKANGEEIYYNTALPQGVGSWASEEVALNAIGTKVADEFSRDFFLQHANVTTQKITLNVDGLPDVASEDVLARELVGLPGVVSATARPPAKPRAYDLQVAGSDAASDIVANGVLKPLNAKLGQACFTLGASTLDQVSVVFDPKCADKSVLSRLETNPPAGLYEAPPGRQKTVTKNPETLRKLTT